MLRSNLSSLSGWWRFLPAGSARGEARFQRENIILGSGSNEVLEFLAHAFLNRGDEVITSEHAFIAYKLIAAVFGARTIEVPGPDLRHDLAAMVAAITPRTRIIFIANPNNPTGTLLSQERSTSSSPPCRKIVVAFDEAYFEYLENPPDTLRFVRERRNIIVLRTFSKIQGLASLRIGYGIARPELIQVLQKTRQPFNVNGLAQTAALAGSRMRNIGAKRSASPTKAGPICRTNSGRWISISSRAQQISFS